MLRIEKLAVRYGDLQVLWDIDLEVREGEVVTVLGSNGAGKSTTLRAISRLLPVASGRISFRGEDLAGLAPHEVVERGVIHVPEGRRIFPEMTVVENLRMGSFVKATRRDRERNMDRVFSLFPRLAERRSQLGGTMSGGEQQMLAIARGLMGNPKVMLLDEPSLGLSPLLVKSIFDIIRTINAQGTTILLVEQNAQQALSHAHRAYVLETGRIVKTGSGEQLLGDPAVRAAYLGVT